MNKLTVNILILCILYSANYAFSQNLKISGIIKERVDKFDKKGRIKENDFDIVDVSEVKISILTKNKLIAETTTKAKGKYTISINAEKEIYFLKIEKEGYFSKISEMDLQNFSVNELLVLDEWDFGIRKNTQNITSPILKKPFERYYYNPNSRELIYDDDYAIDYQIRFGTAVFTKIEQLKKETPPTPENEKALSEAENIINSAQKEANLLLENAKINKEKINRLPIASALSDEKLKSIKKQLKKELDIEFRIAKKNIYNEIKDSILAGMNNNVTLLEAKKVQHQEIEDDIDAKKLKLKAQKQQLEIQRLRALTSEDSLIIELKEQQIASAEAEIKNSEALLQLTKSELEAEHKELLLRQAENKNQRNIILFISLLFILILIASFFVYKNFKEKQRSAKLLKEQNNIIAQKNDSILSSIKYAKRIQEAILPHKKIWENTVPNSFILYMPKDIVSGDFYWLHKINRDEIMIAVVDCTGHGVPGGFMSIVGYYSLHRAINEFKLTKPSDILDSMQKSVNAVLRQGFSNSIVKDGMDISLCVLNTKTNKLQYAGAYNPLWILRANEMIEISATKQAVGSFIENLVPFKNHEIQLQKDDIIYIFSDGYADQFGGAKGKKVMSRGLKKLLLEYKNLTPNQTRIELKKYFYNWMNEGDEDQVDDVCIIGVKI